MYISIIFLPLLGSLLVGFLGRFVGYKGSNIISLFFVGLSFLCSLFIFKEVSLSGNDVFVSLFNWISVGTLSLEWSLRFDVITSVMLVVITSISFLVHLYSTSYMEGDPHIIRFMSYLSIFTFFMIVMVTSANFAQLFLGWEGVGLSSYLLINFWFTRLQANKAAIKAIIVNRFGDFGVMVALFVMFVSFNSFDFAVLRTLVDSFSEYYLVIGLWEFHMISVVSFFLLLGCVGKSAQLGLHTWLPDAMEGPTPVSALIHAATMVTAGVFLLIRSSFILEYSLNTLSLIVVMGSLTAFFAGTVGIFQNDLKRVIAYSTCSQLGYMVFSCGLSSYSVAMFHLSNHAFFKALLFLSAGSVIHAVSDEQDVRRMGGLVKLLPLTYSSFLIGSLALMGFPYTTGYYSKDVILELSFSNYYLEGLFSYWLGVLAAGCTAFYSIRLLYLTFLAETNSSKGIIRGVHDAPARMAIPLIVLSVASTFVGYIFKDMFIGLGTNFWGNSVFVSSAIDDVLILEAEYLPAGIKMLPVIFSLCVGFIAFIMYSTNFKHKLYLGKSGIWGWISRGIYAFFNQKWYFDQVYTHYLVNRLLSFSYNITFKLLDRGLIELYGPTGLVRVFSNYSGVLKRIQSGYLFNYVFIIVVGSFAFLLINLTPDSEVIREAYGLFSLVCFFYLLRIENATLAEIIAQLKLIWRKVKSWFGY
jgi:NADH-ubiquinone oxidoreductase chain 5